MKKVSLERYYFVLYNVALTLKMSKMALNRFAIKLFIYRKAETKERNLMRQHSPRSI